MTAGRNKGKKYKKLQGFEQATPETEARAAAFMKWYGENFTLLRDKLIFAHLYDDQLATDTALNVYDCIALKGFVVVDYQYYFLRAYHTNRIAGLKRVKYETDLDQVLDRPALPDFDYEGYELAVDLLNTEMLDFVRAKYDPLSVSLFEIYIGLLPNMSYKRLSQLLGIPVTRVWTSLGAIRKDLAHEFAERKEYMLSVI